MPIEVCELHFSNKCTANCVVCSKAHGGENLHFMLEPVLHHAIRRIKELPNNPKIELGGDGDALLHWLFAPSLDLLKKELPNCKKELFTNGFLLTANWANRIISDKLIDRIEIRIDSLKPHIYEAATGLPLKAVMANIVQFAAMNARAGNPVEFGVLHLPLYKYPHFCRTVLGKEPTYFPARVPEDELEDEWPAIKNWADQLGIGNRVTGISLWAERTDCAGSISAKCPRLPENYPGDMGRQIYIYPNGNIGLCGYDDGQDTFILGNVVDTGLEEALYGEKAKSWMNSIRHARPYPCIDPRACVMWEYDDRGNPIDPAVKRG